MPVVIKSATDGHRAPPGRVGLGLAVAPAPGLLLLSIGSALDGVTRDHLVGRGCRIVEVADLASGLAALASLRVQVVLVEPSIDVEGDGVRFASGLKLDGVSVDRVGGGLLARARGSVPFVLLPFKGTSEYAVIRDRGWVLRDTAGGPLFRAILEAAGSVR